jgi:glucose/arabinose dehydrogenase
MAEVQLRETVGLLFANDHLYYQDGTRIMRVPYTPGERTTTSASEQVANITVYIDGLHWPKPMDIADDGTIYVGNGSYENEGASDYRECYLQDRPFRGGILKLDGSPGGTPVVKGFRNPISVRCARGHNLCFAIELAKDYSNAQGGREKILPIREGEDWGFPCCASKDLPYSYIQPPPDCAQVAQESESFYIGNTPFDLDFEKGRWPEPWKGQAYMALHGAAGTWKGARMVAVDSDSMTGQLLPGSDLSGMSSGAMMDFATGWDDSTLSHGRPAVLAFAEDGRLLLGNDINGDIIWIAPLDLEIPR